MSVRSRTAGVGKVAPDFTLTDQHGESFHLGTAIGATLANRQAGQPDHVLAIAWRAQHRLHRLERRLRQLNKPANVATVAVARELAGFLWAELTDQPEGM